MQYKRFVDINIKKSSSKSSLEFNNAHKFIIILYKLIYYLYKNLKYIVNSMKYIYIFARKMQNESHEAYEYVNKETFGSYGNLMLLNLFATDISYKIST